ncbi:MAG TPA: acyl-CoA dehydrogenase family protein [Woeseiaceae bacterium]|nr:acyl-CoA dehydrogenase family protein [Woeseiaceae bacterium]
MDFSVSDEQAMLADSVARFIDNDYDFETRQSIAGGDKAFSPDMWRTFAELGWTAVPFDEEDGGLGGGPVELMLMMEQFGRGLIVEPFLPTVVLAGGVLRRAANTAQKERWLLPLIAGELQAALAFAEPQSRFSLSDVTTTATAVNGKYRLNGRKAFVLNGGEADLLVVPARTGGSQRDIDGITLFAIAADADGVARRTYATVDAHGAAEVELQDALVDADAVLGQVGKGFGVLEEAVDEAILAVSAEATGILRTMHDKTVEYSKNRVQFGVPIGSFQALQHRMVDMLMVCEQCRSLLLWTTMVAAAGGDGVAAAVSALKYQVGRSGRLVAQEAVQIHGGMGVTWELDIAHYFKRFTAIETLFGNADFHLDRYLRLSEGFGAE